jgi:hypothetical protein
VTHPEREPKSETERQQQDKLKALMERVKAAAAKKHQEKKNPHD